MHAIPLNTFLREHSAISEHEMKKFQAWGAGFRGVPRNRQLVPWFKHFPAKAGFRQTVWIAKFGAPMYHFAFVVRHVEQKAAMGIGPKPFRHSSLQCDLFVPHVRNTRSVVRQQGDAYRQQANNQAQRRYDPMPHPNLHAEPIRNFRFGCLVGKSYAYPVFDAIRLLPAPRLDFAPGATHLLRSKADLHQLTVRKRAGCDKPVQIFGHAIQNQFQSVLFPTGIFPSCYRFVCIAPGALSGQDCDPGGGV
jgi:hypothetical protein